MDGIALILQEAAFPPYRALATSDQARLPIARCLLICFSERWGITGAALSMNSGSLERQPTINERSSAYR